MSENCKGTIRGEIRPLVDANQCEGKSECVKVCPYDVFEVIRMPGELFRSLTWMGKLKALGHGRKTAATPNADQCLNCGLCVESCPEGAIRLVKYQE